MYGFSLPILIFSMICLAKLEHFATGCFVAVLGDFLLWNLVVHPYGKQYCCQAWLTPSSAPRPLRPTLILAPSILWPEAHFGQRHTSAPIILWPDAYFGPKQFQPNALLPEDQIFNYQFVIVVACFLTSHYKICLSWKCCFIKVKLMTSISRPVKCTFESIYDGKMER